MKQEGTRFDKCLFHWVAVHSVGSKKTYLCLHHNKLCAGHCCSSESTVLSSEQLHKIGFGMVALKQLRFFPFFAFCAPVAYLPVR